MANKHDKRYKKLFSNPLLVEELLTSFVKEDFVHELDYSTLERLDKSFVTDEFKEKESDMIYKVNFKGEDIYIFLLIEFQSTVDRFMSVRILRYICEFYEFLSQKEKLSQLPAVFPILLYNGDPKWTAPYNINELIDSNISSEFIPDFRYYPIIENEISEETLLSIKNAVSAIFYIENSTPEAIKEHFEKVVTLIEKEKPEIIKLFKLWINNLFGYKENIINDEIDKLEVNKDMFATALRKHDEIVATKFRTEGKTEGRTEGRVEGRVEGKYEMVMNMFDERLDISLISKVSGLSKEEILKIKNGS